MIKLATDDLSISVKQEIITDEKIPPFSNKFIFDINYKSDIAKITYYIPRSTREISRISSAFEIISWIRFENNKTFIGYLVRSKKQFSRILLNNILSCVKIAQQNLKNNFFKLMSNSIYGKLLYNGRKNQTVTKLITSETRSLVKHDLTNCLEIIVNKRLFFQSQRLL